MSGVGVLVRVSGGDRPRGNGKRMCRQPSTLTVAAVRASCSTAFGATAAGNRAAATLTLLE